MDADFWKLWCVIITIVALVTIYSMSKGTADDCMHDFGGVSVQCSDVGY